MPISTATKAGFKALVKLLNLSGIACLHTQTSAKLQYWNCVDDAET